MKSVISSELVSTPCECSRNKAQYHPRTDLVYSLVHLMTQFSVTCLQGNGKRSNNKSEALSSVLAACLTTTGRAANCVPDASF